jgi:fused
VRAKCCNLIGNLCRHSSRFYSILSTFVSSADCITPLSSAMNPISFPCSPLTLLTTCCADVDASTRKFACFAVGNAAFHCEELYPSLHCSIPLLASASESEADEKTRANAAGAIGNLVRNGGVLAAEMARVLVPLTLLRSVLIETDLPTQRIALFSLGTMAVYPSCRYTLLFFLHSLFLPSLLLPPSNRLSLLSSPVQSLTISPILDPMSYIYL